MSGGSQARGGARVVEPAPAPARTAARPPQPADVIEAANDLQPLPVLPLGRGDFSGVPARGGGPEVHDADAARALVTRLLVQELVAAFGLDASRITIRTDEEAKQTLETERADGLQRGEAILLHPDRYRPAEPAGRLLLAHEAVHAAQRRGGRPAPQALAEREADDLAAAWVRRRRAPRPRFAPEPGRAALKGPEPQPSFGDLVRENHAEELAEMRRSLSYGVFDWAVTDGDVADCLRILEAQPFVTRVELVAALEDPFPARLADNISPGHFKRYRSSIVAAYDAITRRQPAVLQDNPFKGMDFTGVEPDEHDALRRIIPAFTALPKGKAWLNGLPKDVAAHVDDILNTTPVYDAADAKKKAFELEQTRKKERDDDAKEVKEGDVAAFLNEARKKLSYSATDWAVTDGEVLSLLDEVSKFLPSPAKLRAVVDTLESEGLMERWVDNLPADALYTDRGVQVGGASVNRRQVWLRVLSLRPAWKNAKAAEDLLSYGLVDWAVTDEDAFLAFELIKSLPESVRAGVYGQFGDKLNEEMSLSMRKGRASNFYTGGKDGGDLESIKAQLLDDRVWTLEQMSRLRQLIAMARAADEGAWVFEQSKSRFESGRLKDAYADRGFFTRVVQAYELYVPPGFARPDGTADKNGRPGYVPEQLKGKPFGTDNFVYTVIKGLDFLFSHTGDLQVINESIGATGLDLTEVQDILGGDISGAEFSRKSDVLDADTDELTQNSFRWDLDHGILELNAALIALNSVNYPAANLKIQTGAIRVHGLNLHMEWPVKSVRATTALKFRLDRLEIADLMLIKPDSMLGFEKVAVDDLHIDLSNEATRLKVDAPDESIAVGAILLTPLYNLIKAYFDKSDLTKSFTEPDSPLDLTVTAGGVTLSAMTTSAGQFVQNVSLKDIALRSRNPHGKDGYRQALMQERDRLQRRLVEVRDARRPGGPAPAHHVEFDTPGSLRRQVVSIEEELKALSDAEAEVAALEAKPQPLSPADQERLDRRKGFLAGVDQGGFALDIGHAEAKGIAGRVSLGDVSLDDVHAYGHSAGAVLGALTGSPSLNRLLRGPGYRGTLAGVELEGDPAGFVKLGDLELNALEVQGDIPSVEQAEKDAAEADKKQKAALSDPKLADEAERLAHRRDNARTYWTLLRTPSLKPADRDAFNAARDALLADKAFSAEQISARGATLELAKGASGLTELGLDAKGLSLHGVKAGGLNVKDVVGTDVRLGAGVQGGLGAVLGLGKDKRALKAAGVSAGSLTLSGIEDRASGLKLDRAAVTNLRARSTFGAGGASAELAADSIELSGVSQALTARMLAYRRDKLMAKPEAERSDAEKAQIKDIGVLLDSLAVAQEQLDAAEAQLKDPKLSADAKAHAAQQKADAEQMLAFWEKTVELKKLTIRDLNIGVTGLGDVLGDDYSFGKALKSGVTVTGLGPDRQMVGGITVEGASARLSAGGTKQTPAGTVVTAGSRAAIDKLEIGPVKGAVTYAEDHVTVDGLEIGSVVAQGFLYAGGSTLLRGKGEAKVEGISLTARLELTPVDEMNPDGDRRLSSMTVTRFGIKRLSGQGIDYRNVDSGLRVVLESGAILGIHAEGATVDFGATDKGPLLVRGGTAGAERLENIRTVATTAGGLTAASTLNAGALTASFADDGAVAADLQAIEANAHITQKDLDATVNAKAKSLHVELLPGAKGYGDATQKFRVEKADIDVTGSKGTASKSGLGPQPTRFGVKIKGLETNDITRKPDGSIDAPFIGVSEITLSRLHLDNGSMVIDVPEGTNVIMAGVTASVTAEANPTPEEQRGKDESAFSRIVIHDFQIPIVALGQMSIVLRDPDKGDLILTLPDRPSSLHNLKLSGPPGSKEGFVISPNKNWETIGRFGMEKADLLGVGADLRSVLVSTADATITNFSVDFLGAEDTVVAFDDLNASHIQGGLKGAGGASYGDKTGSDPGASDAIVSKLTRAGFHLDYSHWTNDPKLHLHKFKSSKKTGVTLEELDIEGLRFDDPSRGLSLDIRKMTLPAGPDGVPALQYTPEGKLIVPLAEVEDAAFVVDDVLKLGGSGKGGGLDSGLTYGPDLSVVDMLSGHVNFSVNPVLSGAAGFGVGVAGPFDVKIAIKNGQIEYGKMEDQSTGNIADFFVDLDYVQGTYDFDYSPPHRIPARLQASINIPFVTNYWWDLDSDEAALVKTGFVNVSTLIKHPIRSNPGDPKKVQKEATVEHLFFGGVDARLELPSSGEIALGNAGSLMLGGGGGPGFVIEVKSDALPAIAASVPKLSANIASMNLKLDTAGTVLKTGAISFDAADDTTLQFETKNVGDVYTDDDGNKTQNELPVPSRLAGTLKKASLHNIELTSPSSGKKP